MIRSLSKLAQEIIIVSQSQVQISYIHGDQMVLGSLDMIFMNSRIALNRTLVMMIVPLFRITIDQNRFHSSTTVYTNLQLRNSLVEITSPWQSQIREKSMVGEIILSRNLRLIITKQQISFKQKIKRGTFHMSQLRSNANSIQSIFLRELQKRNEK